MGCAYLIAAIFLFLMVSFLVSGCSPKIIENVRTQIEYRDRVQRDSLYFRDSIYVKEKVKGDTVYLEKYIDRWRYKEKSVHDTTYVAVHDTTTVTKEVEKCLTAVQQMKQDSWWWLVLVLVGLLGYTFRKPLLAIIKRLI